MGLEMRRPFLRLFSALTVAVVASNTVEAQQGTGAALTVSLESGGSAGSGSTPVMLLRDSFEALLKKNGMSLVDWHKACAAESPQCQQAIVSVAQSKAVVAVQAPDAAGRVTFAGLPPGRYYVFVMREASNGLDVWDVGTDLQQAPSSVQLTMRNLVMQNGSRTAVAPAPAAASPSSGGHSFRGPVDCEGAGGQNRYTRVRHSAGRAAPVAGMRRVSGLRAESNRGAAQYMSEHAHRGAAGPGRIHSAVQHGAGKQIQ